MPGPIAALGMQAAGNVINEGMGLMTQPLKNKEQVAQQRKLNNVNLEAEATRNQRNEAMAMRMWENTNYGPQMEQLKKAGLNPGLIYGMSGGGGQSTAQPGATGGGGATVGQASHGSEGMGLMMGQMGLLEAQRKNIEADTKLKEAETENKPIQGNQIVAQTKLTGVQEEIAQVQASVARQTIKEQMKAMENIVERGTEEIKALKLQNKLSEEQMKDKIKLLKAEAIGAVLQNELTKAQTTKTGKETEKIGSDMAVNDQLIRKWSNEIAAMWENVTTNRMNANVNDENSKNSDRDFPPELTEILSQAVDGILKGQGPVKRNPIGYK